jgi:hypothetical protein
VRRRALVRLDVPDVVGLLERPEHQLAPERPVSGRDVEGELPQYLQVLPGDAHRPAYLVQRRPRADVVAEPTVRGTDADEVAPGECRVDLGGERECRARVRVQLP